MTKRCLEDPWEPINCYNDAGAEQFVADMVSAGIPNIRSYLYNDCFVTLTRNTADFTLSYLALADSVLKLFNPSLRYVFV